MMKSYRKWKSDERYFEMLPEILEWSFQNIFGRKMGSQSKEEMGRIATMLGKEQNWWNPLDALGKDSSQYGDDFMSDLQSGNLDKILGKAAPNSPFKQAFDLVDNLKRKIAGGGADKNTAKFLIEVLKNAHKNGNINIASLKALWDQITGIIQLRTPESDNQPDPAILRSAKNLDVQTPMHLLRQLTSIGNGLFDMPANIHDIKSYSNKLLRQFYPNEYHQLKRSIFHPQLRDRGSHYEEPQSQHPATDSTLRSIDPAQFAWAMHDLERAMSLQDSDSTKKSALQDAYQKLKELSPEDDSSH